MATDLEQVNRLKSLNGTDPAMFVLALYSYIEYYCKNELGKENWTSTDHFARIIKAFRYPYQQNMGYIEKRE